MPDSWPNAAMDCSNLYFMRYSRIAKFMSSFYLDVRLLVCLNRGFSVATVATSAIANVLLVVVAIKAKVEIFVLSD